MKVKTPELTSATAPFQFKILPVEPSAPPRNSDRKFALYGSILSVPVKARVVCPLPGALFWPSKAIQSDFKVIDPEPVAIRTLVPVSPKSKASAAEKVAPPPLIVMSASVFTSLP